MPQARHACFCVRLSETRIAIRQAAIQTLEKHGDDPEVYRQVEALAGSLDDTLSDEVVLKELKALKNSGQPFQQVFAELPRGRK